MGWHDHGCRLHGHHADADVDRRAVPGDAETWTDLPADHAHGRDVLSVAARRARAGCGHGHAAVTRSAAAARRHSFGRFSRALHRRGMALCVILDDERVAQRVLQLRQLRVLDVAEWRRVESYL